MPSPSDNPAERIAELARVLHTEEPLDESLRRVAATALDVLNRCDAASVSMSQDGRITTWTSTHPSARCVDEHQYRTEEGPCLDAIRTGEPHFVDSMESEDRWPSFAPLAAKEGMVAVYSVPLRLGEDTVGALNLYSRSRPFAFPDLQVAEALASQAAVTLANARAFHHAQDRVVELEEALESNDGTDEQDGEPRPQ